MNESLQVLEETLRSLRLKQGECFEGSGGEIVVELTSWDFSSSSKVFQVSIIYRSFQNGSQSFQPPSATGVRRQKHSHKQKVFCCSVGIIIKRLK
jgi:hypothetical protein